MGNPVEWTRQYKRDRILYGDAGRRWTDATGTHRRLQALVAAGWGMRTLSLRLGGPQRVRRMLKRQLVFKTTAAAVKALYDELWDKQPTVGDWREQMVVTAAKRYAERRGWVPPMAWDDEAIDDPTVGPYRPQEHKTGSFALTRHEVAHLVSFGLSNSQIAERLGIQAHSVQAVRRQLAVQATGGCR